MGQPSPERHLCHCGRGFLRKEHLRRHQATHSTPSFTCHVCSRSFTRSDLLRRHLTLHDVPVTPESKRARACDTCHASKIRCDGGARCSLCTKRGIECTFNRGSATQSQGSHSKQSLGASNPASELSHSSDKAETESVSATEPSSGGDSQPETARHSQEGDAPPASTRGLHKVLDNLTSNPFDASQKPSYPLSADVKAWASSCLSTFFGSFHDRWAILHAPSFEQDDDSIILRGTALMIGCWLQGDLLNKALVFNIHDVLVKQTINELSESSTNTTSPWPITTCQAALLNIIFAFESGQAGAITKARFLFSLLITVLRHKQVFNSEALAQELKTHSTGDFPPYIYAYTERWKRLVFFTFKLDTYLSLFGNQPPLIQREELCLGLTSTYCLWNAHGLDVFFRRWPTEPLARDTYKLCDLAIGSQQPVPAGMLVEDVLARIMGTANYVWILNQMRGNTNTGMHVAADQKDTVSARLRRCKLQLDCMAGIWSEPHVHKQPYDCFLRAYAGREDPAQQSCEASIKARFMTGVLSTTMLYHLLNMHIYADVHMFMQELPESVSSREAIDPALPESGRRWWLKEWASSAECRFAIMHCLLAYRIYRESAAPSDLSTGPIDPIIYMTLSAAAATLWAWAMNEVSSCSCLTMHLMADLDFGYIPLGAAKNPEVENWIRNGGDIALHGVRLCWCNVNAWLSPFAAILSHGAVKWEIGNVFAQRLWAKLGLSR